MQTMLDAFLLLSRLISSQLPQYGKLITNLGQWFYLPVHNPSHDEEG